MSVEHELLKFSKTRPVWQQDLLRRICTRSASSGETLEAALVNLKAAHGLAKPLELLPLSDEHVKYRGPEFGPRVKLAAISSVRNANQLAPNQFLPFGLTGLTVIYGDNGSGKTGYARILKQLCRARRERPEPLLGKVYKAPSGPAMAKITFFLGEEQRQFDWQDGKPAPPEFSRISVFDATTAPLYADRLNEIEFLPWGLDVLPQLGQTCQELAGRLQNELDQLDKTISVPLPQQVPGSSAANLVQRLQPETPEPKLPTAEEIQRSAAWSAEDELALNRLEGELLKISEPAKAAAQCRRLSTSVGVMLRRLQSVERLVGPEAIRAYKEQFSRTLNARQAAAAAAETQFESDPLGKFVGGEPWRTLYRHAEQFNTSVYPGEESPATGTDRVCLLCQQPFSGSAADRMKRFQTFMRDTTQRELQREESKLATVIETLRAASIPNAEEIDLQYPDLTADFDSFKTLKTKSAQFASESSSLRSLLIEGLTGRGSLEDIRPLDMDPIQATRLAICALNEKAETFDRAAVNDSALNALRSQHNELLGRRHLSDEISTILSRAEALKNRSRINRCHEACDTYQISRQNSAFREKYLTIDLERNISEQITLLDLEYLPVRVESKTERGASYVGVGLKKIASARNANILSEGEFRALALACFFAEIETIPSHEGIVIDDPVSSLDHRHMRQVAKRLVNEAKVRSQVIVFTHDLTFYYDLVSLATEAQVPVARNWAKRSGSGTFGVVSHDDSPWQVKSASERFQYLDMILISIPEKPNTEEEHSKYVREFYTHLRETWERLVDETLLNKVSSRFQPGVQTQSLRGVTVTDTDHYFIFTNMKRVSEFSGHDRAVARTGSLPGKKEMANELAVVRAYEKDLTKRREITSRVRRELESPQEAPQIPPPGLG